MKFIGMKTFQFNAVHRVAFGIERIEHKEQ